MEMIRRPWRLAMEHPMLAVFLVALASKTAIVVLSGQYAFEPMGEIPQVGRVLASRGEFADPFNQPTGPTAHVAPVWPWFVASVYALTPSPDAARLSLQALGILFAALSWGLLPWFASRLGFPRRVGLAAGLTGALFPFQFRAETTGYGEACAAPLVVMGLSLLCFRMIEGRMSGVIAALGCGAAWGFTVLFSTSYLSIAGGVLAAFLLWPGRPPFPGWKWLSAAVLAAILVLAPWTVRNYSKLNAIFLVRDNLGLELQMSNNEISGPHMSDNNPVVNRKYHPNQSPEQCRILAGMGEVEYNRMKMRMALDWIRGNPGRFIQLTAQRIWLCWVPKRGYLIGAILEALIAAAGIAGLVLARRRGIRGAILLQHVLIFFPLIYYFIQTDERYMYPVRWILYVGVAYLLSAIRAGAAEDVHPPA
jgi:hypothetical protein